MKKDMCDRCRIVAMIFVILGIYQYRAKDPVTINTGETSPFSAQKNEERIYKIIGFCLGGEKSPLFYYV